MDKDKFLWIGTTRGLSRFDGYNFKNFINDKNNKQSLHGTSIIGISEGIDGKIWLSTDAGIEYFDKLTETFYLIKLPEIAGTAFLKNISIDYNGNVWAYSDSTKFICLHKSGLKYLNKRIDLSKQIEGKEKFEVYRFIVQNDILFIASNYGIFSYNTQNKSIKFIEKRELKHCYSMQKSNDSTLVLTFLFEGVYILNTKHQNGKWIDKKIINNSILPNSFSYDATIENDSSIWIGTASGLFSLTKNTVKCFSSKSKTNYFDGDLVTCIYKDKDNSVWFGTIENGLYCKKNKSKNFTLVSKLNKEDINKTTANNLCVFSDNSLLFNSLEAVYYCKSSADLSAGCANQIFKGIVITLFPIDERYCLFSNVDTIFLFDSFKKTITRKAIVKSVFSACKDLNGVFWIGTWNGVLTGIDFEHNKKYSLNINSPIFTLLVDNDGSLWIGTFGNGLFHINNQTSTKPKIEKFSKNAEGRNKLNTNIIHHLHVDISGNLWVGTCGDGLFKYNRESQTFTNYSIENGLKSNIIESIISDKSGNIWFASKGLTKYDIRKKSFTHFTQSDDLSCSFMAKSCTKSPDGRLFFSSSKGIIVFNPNNIKIKKILSIPILTGLRIKGIPVQAGYTFDGNGLYKTAITYTNEIAIPFAYNSFAIEFACLQFQDSQNLFYEYKLIGIDNDWIPSDANSRIANYSGLQSGTYKFMVRASIGDGQWSKARTITINIIPPWWKSWWFRFSMFLILTISILIIILSRFRLIKRQNQELERKVLERTEEISSANHMLYKKNNQLKETQILIEMRNLDLNEALHAKDELMKVVSHDFKNPLTGIIEMAEILLTENLNTKTDKSKKIAESILSNAKSLVDQMFTVLDWAQSHNKELEAMPIEINLEMLLDDAISLVRESASQKNISITKQIEIKTNAFVDPRMISIVFRNLLNNAITFTNQGGSILILIQEHDNGIDSVFIDTGIGIVNEKLETIFNKTTSISENSGTVNGIVVGVGLELCKSFVEKNLGQIKASSQKENGSIFTVSLPKGQNQVTNKTKIQSLDILKNTNPVDSNDPFTILVIDDNIEVIEIIENLFDEHVTVVKAEEGNRGLYIAQNILPDIIICDILLPGKNGLDICKVLKNNDLTSFIPVLLISSQNSDDIEVKSFESGANDFIEKPFNPYTLKQKVLSLLEFRKHIREEILKSIESNQQTNMPIDYDNKIIKKVIDFINTNISDPDLNVETIVDKIGISRAHLWRIFKKTTDKSLGDYIREIKMHKAAEMLKTGKYRVSEVAAEVGFFDAKNFSKNFSKEYGMTPSQYIDSSKK